MHVVDSRELVGPGILAMQDFRPIDPDVRHAILAVRVVGRDDMGMLEVEDGTYGDFCNASVWKKDTRPMPGWSFAWSVLATKGKGTVTNASTPDPGAGGTPPQGMKPAKGFSSDRTPDDRFASEALGYPDFWPSFPEGWAGIALAGSEEDKQRFHWHPTDPRLVAPHRGIPELSSIVTDCVGSIPDVAARLATHLFVVNAPSLQGEDDSQVKASGDDAAGTEKKKNGIEPERSVFGFGPPTLSFPQTPGTSASGKPLSSTPHLNAQGDMVYGAEDAGTEGGNVAALFKDGSKKAKGSLGQNSLAWLVGWSNGFHGGFVLDNEPKLAGMGGGGTGEGTYTGPNSGGPGTPLRPPSQSLPAGGGTGQGGNFTYQLPAGLPPGAGNVARYLVNAIGQTAAQNPFNVPRGLWSKPAWPPPITPKAHPLAELGVTVGVKDGRKIVALVSANYGGFLHVGTEQDTHNIGTDADGNPINPAHLSWKALFYADKDRDGPLGFEGAYYHGGEFDYPAYVHLAFDGDTGYWRSWTTIPMDLTATEDDPARPITPGGDQPPPNRPITPFARAYIGGTGDRSYLAVTRETSFAVILGRPQSQVPGVRDYRVSSPWEDDDREAAIERLRRTPVTFRLEAFGKQTDEWERTHPENAPYRGGTADGGLFLMPPESRLEDPAPAGFDLSTTYLGLYETRLGFGIPYPSTGGVASGWSARLAGSDLAFATHDAASVATDVLRLLDLGSGDLGLKVLTAGKSLKIEDSAGNVVVEVKGSNKLGFYAASPTAKQIVSGSRANPEEALKDLLSKLATLGLITDSTSS